MMQLSMEKIIRVLRTSGLQLLAVLIALILWVQVHGQGTVSISMDVPLQVEGLRPDLAIINNLPDHVRVTISGLQARLNTLKPTDVRVPLSVAHMDKPGVVKQALEIADIRLPAGLTATKLQPDRLQVQLDRVVQRAITVKPHVQAPNGWQAVSLSVRPAQVMLAGPEVWMGALSEVATTLVHPEAKAGRFKFSVNVESPSGKAIRVVDAQKKFILSGLLRRTPAGKAGKMKGG
ncbi:MAG: hypothetical protein Q9M25_10105 [Mariprofundaceae bacterium]|nr:hypothetical protein [Mariprofundaceae bacterium]